MLIIGREQPRIIHLQDDCIKTFHLGRYIAGYMVANSVLRRLTNGAIKVISERISDEVIPVLMQFCNSSQIGTLQVS